MKPTTAEFFKKWREKYRWPYNTSRTKSEKKIQKLQNDAQTALITRNTERLAEVLVDIHKWKTKNRSGGSTLYGETINTELNWLNQILEQFPISSDISADKIIAILEQLDRDYAKMPVCSAQLSFLSNRQLPIVDRYVGQFMSQKFDRALFKSKDHDFHEICQILGKVDFAIDKSTRNLATQGSSNNRNRELYARKMVPKLKQVANQLNALRVTYNAIDGTNQAFTCVDVEMTLFASATHIRHRYCFSK